MNGNEATIYELLRQQIEHLTQAIEKLEASIDKEQSIMKTDIKDLDMIINDKEQRIIDEIKEIHKRIELHERKLYGYSAVIGAVIIVSGLITHF